MTGKQMRLVTAEQRRRAGRVRGGLAEGWSDSVCVCVLGGAEEGEGGCSYPGRPGHQQYAGGGWLVLLSWARRQLGPWVSPRIQSSPLCCPGEVRQIHVSSYTEIANDTG